MLWFTITKTAAGRHNLHSATGHKNVQLGEQALARAKRIGGCDGVNKPFRHVDEARHWVDAQNTGLAPLIPTKN